MEAIRIQKIDGQEFVPLKDYKMLEEENKAVGILSDEIRRINKNLREENQKLKEKLEQIKETYIRFEDSEEEYNKGLGELDKLIMNR